MAGLDGNIEPIYFLITSIAFIFLSVVQYKKSGKTKETIYLSILSIFFFIYLSCNNFNELNLLINNYD